MQDDPNPIEILASVAALLRDEIMPQLSGAHAFNARVAANALDLVQRQLQIPANVPEEENQALRHFLGMEGDTAALTRELARRIADRTIDAADPALAALLFAITEAKLDVDQPRYGGLQLARKLRMSTRAEH